MAIPILRSGPGMLSLENETGLPATELAGWNARASIVDGWWDWFTSDALKVVDREHPGVDGRFPLKFPLQINPFKMAARLHSFALFGTDEDTGAPLVHTLVNTEDVAQAERIEEALNTIDYDNDARSMYIDMGLSIQALGGLAMRVSFEPDNDDLTLGIRKQWFDPRVFHARYVGRDYWNLSEAWLKYEVTQAQAEDYGVKLQSPTATYIEYWNRREFFVKIDGNVASYMGRPLKGPNKWGFVPFVYLPHERANGFWGTGIIEDVIGLAKEMNSRMTDVGDAMHVAVNDILIAKNLKPNFPVIKTLPNGQPYADLGRSIGTDPEPEMTRLSAPALPSGADKFNVMLEDMMRTYLMTPQVAYGHEEGTQRSGETLAMRMWPLISHTNQERSLWTSAMNRWDRMALRMLAMNGLGGITTADTKLRLRRVWAPAVPLDRAKLVEELIRRKQENSISLTHMINRLGDVADVDGEVEAIFTDMERAQEITKPEPPVVAAKADSSGGMMDAQDMPMGDANGGTNES